MPQTKAKRAASSQTLRLQIEMIPEALAGINIRNVLSKKQWIWVRDAVTAHCERACAICGSEEQPEAPLHGHEVWEYTEKRTTGVATLVDINLVCQDCHSIIHFGRFGGLLADKTIIPEEFNRVIEHALRVNGCTGAEWEKHCREAQKVYQRRSKLSWEVDYGLFQWAVDYLPGAPAHETRKVYKLFRRLNCDLKAMQERADGEFALSKKKRLREARQGNRAKERDRAKRRSEPYVDYGSEPEPWEYLGIDPGEAADMWWLWHDLSGEMTRPVQRRPRAPT